MPTYETTRRFERDYASLTREQREAFREALRKLVEDLEKGKRFRRSLRIKGVRGAEGVFEMTWAPNGRATFQFGNPVTAEEPHVVWRRCGTHDVFDAP